MITSEKKTFCSATGRNLGTLLGALILLGAGSPASGEPWTAVVDPMDGRYLYLNDTGAVLAAGPFLQAESFSGGFGRTASDGASVYLKPDGTTAFSLPIPFRDTAAFSEGLAAFVRGGLVGFVDDQGREAIAPQFVLVPTAETGGWSAPRFQQGRAVVGHPARYGWIKADGSLVEGVFPSTGFSKDRGFRPVSGGWELIDADGQRLNEEVYEAAQGFSEGAAFVVLGGKPSWIDGAGQILATWPEGTVVGPLVGGYAVFARDGGTGLMDKKGKEVVPSGRYEALQPIHSTADTTRAWKFQEAASGLWGLINERGAVLAKAQWESIGVVREGLAVVVVGGRSAFASPKGWLATPLTEYRLGSLREGLAPVEKDGLWGFADARGKVVLEGKWKAVGEFTGGLAPVQTDLGWALVDKKGKPVGPQNYQHLGPLVSGRRLFFAEGKAGYLGETGQPVLPAVYDRAGDFLGSQAWVVHDGVGGWIGVDGKSRGPEGFEPIVPVGVDPPFAVVRPTRFGLIDKSGTFLVPPVYQAVVDGPGLVWAHPGSNQPWEALDGGTKAFVLEDWVPAGPFSEGWAVVSRPVGDRREWALVDGRANLTRLEVRDVRPGLASGRLCVQFPDGQWGYIDPTGRPLFGLHWDDARPFSEGFAAVAFDGQWGYVDSQGVKILPYQYDAAGEFRLGLAPVTIGESKAFITKTGQRVWP